MKQKLQGLNLKKLLSKADPDTLNIWQRTKKGINSFKPDSQEEAIDFYNNGASLYLSSGSEIRDLYCKQL